MQCWRKFRIETDFIFEFYKTRDVPTFFYRHFLFVEGKILEVKNVVRIALVKRVGLRV
jgi:hypothetical protein